MTAVLPTQQRSPFEVYLLCVAFLSGLANVVGVHTARSIESTMHPAVVTGWGVLLVLGSAGALAGMFWPGELATALVVRKTGLLALGWAATIYVVVLVLYFGTGAATIAAFVSGFAAACFWRVRDIGTWIRAASGAA